ncbi:MAG: hypothetical protein AB1351_10960 [Thermoproteota archaeon]
MADVPNIVLRKYGNATEAPFDLTDMSNLVTNQNNLTMDDGMPMSNDTMMSNTTGNITTMVDMAAYQSAQYLANKTIVIFDDMLRLLTTTTVDNATNIERLKASLMQLIDRVNNHASPNDVMAIVHLGIHPMLILLCGLVVVPEEA